MLEKIIFNIIKLLFNMMISFPVIDLLIDWLMWEQRVMTMKIKVKIHQNNTYSQSINTEKEFVPTSPQRRHDG